MSIAFIQHELETLGVPLGGVLVGLVMGGALYAAFEWFRRRPTTSFSGTVPITAVDAPTSGSAPSGPLVGDGVPVEVFGSAGTRVIYLRGAGKSPNAPLPRARTYLATLLLSFAALSVLVLAFFGRLFLPYDRVVGYVGTALYWPSAWPGVYTITNATLVVPDYIFPMYLVAMGSFAFASGLVYHRPSLPASRRGFALLVVVSYIAVELVLDALFFTIPGQSIRDVAIVVRSLTGGFFLAFLIFCTIFLPTPRQVEPRFAHDTGSLVQFFGTGVASFALAGAALFVLDQTLGTSAILLPFTLLLMLPLVTFELFIVLNRPLYFLQLRRRPRPSVAVYHPAVSIVMPAFNEERWIAEAIRHADVASRNYPGTVEIIVGNDGSVDRTSELARKAIGELKHATGAVVDLPHAGKSNALNGALALSTGEIVIRCDADTFISEELGFAAIIPHFADPEVGGVQGSILPRQREGWTRKLRALEIAWGHYFQRPAIMGARAGEVIDGLFSAFRRRDLVALGGWVPWNGEDTEISMRIQRLGYRVRMEFGARAYEDVPENYDALRRQRVRWARGILMANGQHYPSLVGETPEFTGVGVLLWFLTFARSGVRSLVYLFLGLLILILGVPALVDVGYLLLLALATRAIPLAYFLLRMGRKDALLWIPFFPIGSILKQSFRFEAFGLLGPDAKQEYV